MTLHEAQTESSVERWMN